MKLLTICIPTYNRCKYLERALSYIDAQYCEDIEVLVSDNCSSDDTQSFMQEYVITHSYVKYNRHEQNLGPDGNFVSLLNKAEGRYVQIHGDDDFFDYGELTKLIQYLKSNEFCLGVLNKDNSNKGVRDVSSLRSKPMNEIFSEDRLGDFFIGIDIWLTFITGLIFNNKYLKMLGNFDQYLNTNLIQSHIAASMLQYNKVTAIIGEVIVTAEQDNTGGYNFFKVFCNNWYDVLFKTARKAGVPKNALRKVFKITINEIIYPYVRGVKLGLNIKLGSQNLLWNVRKCITYSNGVKCVALSLVPNWFIRSLRWVYRKTIKPLRNRNRG